MQDGYHGCSDNHKAARMTSALLFLERDHHNDECIEQLTTGDEVWVSHKSHLPQGNDNHWNYIMLIRHKSHVGPIVDFLPRNIHQCGCMACYFCLRRAIRNSQNEALTWRCSIHENARANTARESYHVAGWILVGKHLSNLPTVRSWQC